MAQNVEHIETALNSLLIQVKKLPRMVTTRRAEYTQHITYIPYPVCNIRDHQIRNKKLHK